jgi:hypothetical protein
MVPLGLGLSGLSEALGDGAAAVVIEDYFFELSSGELQPRDSFSDFSDVWDLDGNSDIQPAATPTEEGYFDIDGNGDIQPKA